MAAFVGACPHCSAERVTMKVFGIVSPPLAAVRERLIGMQVAAAGSCPICYKPVAILIDYKPAQPNHASWNDFLDATGKLLKATDDIMAFGFRISGSWPSATIDAAPEHTPVNVARVYLQARSAFRRNELDAAGMMFRKALEVAVKELDAGGSRTLQQGIDELGASGKVPQMICDWAHEVRIIGNEIAHDGAAPDPVDVKQAAEFAEAFLQYTFTLPAKYEARQSMPETEAVVSKS